MVVPNNKKYYRNFIHKFMEENYPEYEVLEIEDACEENKHKPRVRFTNGYEIKFAYFDNIKRGKFKFTIYTPKYIKEILEKNYDIKINSVIHLDDKFSGKTLFEIATSKGKVVRFTGDYINRAIVKGVNIFCDKRKKEWTKEEVYEYLGNPKFGLSNIRLEYDTSKKFSIRNCTVHFTYDKVEMSGKFRTLRDALTYNRKEYLNLERGETFYKALLKEKFGIENIGFNRLYKTITASGKKTYMADIYNIEDGTEVKGVLTDNLKKRGYYFKKYQGEVVIENFLKEFNIEYEKQKTFHGCKNIQNLRFDFYLPRYELCIEYDGEFHYTPFDFAGGETGLKIQQERDRIKDIFCEKEGLNLLRIPYFKKDLIKDIIQDIVSPNQK